MILIIMVMAGCARKAAARHSIDVVLVCNVSSCFNIHHNWCPVYWKCDTENAHTGHKKSGQNPNPRPVELTHRTLKIAVAQLNNCQSDANSLRSGPDGN